VNTKQILIILLSLIGLVILLLVGFMVIYSTSPSFLGFAPKDEKSQSSSKELSSPPLKTSQNYLISETDFTDLLRAKTLAENTLESHNHIVDSLAKIIHSKDSAIANLSTLQDSLKIYAHYLEASYKSANELRDSIAKLYQANPNLKNGISKSKQSQNEPTDSLKMENIRQFANIYKNSNPVQVAKILEKMDNRTAAEILKLLPAKQAGKIIDELPEDKAASILLLK